MNILKKVTLSLLASLILFTSTLSVFARPAKAQSPWYRQSFSEFVGIVDGGEPSELYGERYTAAQVRWVVWGLFYFILDNDFVRCAIQSVANGDISQCSALLTTILQILIGQTQATNLTPTEQFAQNSATIGYVRSIGARWNLVPEADAQSLGGFGFEVGANSIQSLWAASRDATYALLILVIIIMAFMIMFRVKISPQTVITVQSALPKVIMTLILITFSYAIAGFVIDLMYVLIGLIAAILVQSGVANPFNGWSSLYGLLTNQASVIELMGVYWIMSIGAFGYAMQTLPIVNQVSEMIGYLVSTIAGVVVLILGFRIWWMFLKNFVMILLSIVFGPFQILMGSLSGKGGFGAWVRNLALLLAVYPLAGFMYVLAFLFLRAAYASSPSLINLVPDGFWPFGITAIVDGSSWIPPLMGTTVESTVVWLGVSIAILSLIPKSADIVKSFASGRPFDTAGGIGEGLAFASGAALWAKNTAVNTAARPLNWASSAAGGYLGSQVGAAVRGRLGLPSASSWNAGATNTQQGQAAGNAGTPPVGSNPPVANQAQGQQAANPPQPKAPTPPQGNNNP